MKKLTMIGSGSYRSSLSIRLVSIAHQMASQGFEVTVIVPSADKYNNFTKEVVRQDGPIKIVQPWQPSTHSQILNLIPYLFTSLLAGIQSRPDYIYLYKPTPISIFGIMLKFLFHVPLSLDLDDLGSEVMHAENQNVFLTKLVEMSEKISLRFSTNFVVTSTYLQQIVSTRYPLKPILLLPNGVDIDLYDYRKETPLRPNVYYFGMINRLSLIEPLLNAAPEILRNIPDAKFTIIGGGKELESAQKIVTKLGISNSVIFTGMTGILGALPYTQFGDIGICYQPDIKTVRAASNMKVFQYMAMSTVPVVSKVGDLPNYLNNETAGNSVLAGRDDLLTKTITGLLVDTETRRNKALVARNLAETTYSWNALGLLVSDFVKNKSKNDNSMIDIQKELS